MNPYKAERIREGLLKPVAEDQQVNVRSISPVQDFAEGSDYTPSLGNERYKREIEDKKLSDNEINHELEKYSDEKILFEILDNLTFVNAKGQDLQATKVLFDFFHHIAAKGILDEEEDLVRDVQKLTRIRTVSTLHSWFNRILKLRPPEVKKTG